MPCETIRPKMWASASIMVNLAHRRTMMVLALDVVAQTTGQSLVEQPLTSVSCIKHLSKKKRERVKMNSNGAQHQQKVGDLCIADSGATHTILMSKKYFSEFRPTKRTIRTISGPVDLIEGTGKTNFILPNGTKFLINNAICSPKSSRNLLSFGDIYLNGYDTQTTTIENKKYLHIIDKSNILEKLTMLHSGLHYTHLSMVESHMVIKEKSCDPGLISLWHDQLSHLGSTMMKRTIESTHGHPLKDQKILQMDKMVPCTSCSLGKLIARTLPLKSTFSDYNVKRVRHDNAGEFTSQAFNDYCMSVGIVVEHPIAHVHTKNGLAESLFKRLQLIARPLIMRTKFPVSIWGHAILHAAFLIRMRPSANHLYSPMQLAFGQEPNISYLRIFGCAVYVPIAPPQQT
ncbi:retrovirus-related pol polyprotein from transposon TNT 1-94 [Tanacetum coccineum]